MKVKCKKNHKFLGNVLINFFLITHSGDFALVICKECGTQFELHKEWNNNIKIIEREKK